MKKLVERNEHGRLCAAAGVSTERIYERLAAYEGTGLTPEDLAVGLNAAARKKAGAEYYGLNSNQLDEAVELYCANEDGCIVVLPCRMGDTVWMIVTKRPKINMPEFSFIKRSCLTWLNAERIVRDFGKSVFLTREEAERALKAKEEGE